MQVSIKISKISHFSSTFKLSEKKKVLLVWRGQGRYIKFFAGGRFCKNFRKGEGLVRKGWRKSRGWRDCDPQRNYARQLG